MLDRRKILQVFAAGVMARAFRPPQVEEPQFAGLDRVEFYVSNVEKSRDFYVQVFGKTLKNRNGKRYVKLGSSYMAFEVPRGAGGQVRIDHFSVSIKNLEMPKLHAFLEQRGIKYQDYPSGRDTAVVDAEGIRTQLSPEDGWKFINTPNFPDELVSMTDEPVFQPIGLEHVLVNVSDLNKSMFFYLRFLGDPAQLTVDRIWFRVGEARVGLQRTPENESAGVHHFCISAAQFDYNTAVQRLRQLGAVPEPLEAGSQAAQGVQFRDPDGFRIQVLPALRK